MYQNLNILGLSQQIIHLPSVYKTVEESPYLQLVMTIQVELMKENFILHTSAMNMLLLADGDSLLDFHSDVVTFVKSIKGEEEYELLYGNFPVDFLDQHDSVLTYESLVNLFNKFSQKENLIRYNSIEYNVIYGLNHNDFLDKILSYLINLTNDYTPETIDVLQNISKKYEKKVHINFINMKNSVTLASLFKNICVKTPIDVLRIAVGFSGGDMNLPPVPKIKNKPVTPELLKLRSTFKFLLNYEQKIKILHLFENCNLDYNLMKTKSKCRRFIKLGEILQVGRFKNKFPKTYNVFHQLRNSRKNKLNEAINCAKA